MKRRRKTDKERGWYEAIPVPPRMFYGCGSCGEESATVQATGGKCLRCRLQERTAAIGIAPARN